MKSLRVLYLVPLVCVLLFSRTGFAAESASSYNWTGPYIGAHIGYGWGNADTGISPLPTANQFINLAPSQLSPGPSGVIGGLQAGYNYQMGCFLVGIEADFSGTGISGNQTSSPIIQNDGTPITGALTAHQAINWYGTLRPRLGYTVLPTLLLYGTGGLAYGNVSYSANTDYRAAGGVFYPTSFSRTKVGWTVGGGMEYGLSKNWSIKTEYLYMDLGNQSAIADPNIDLPPFRVGYNWKTTAHLVNVGLNYRF